MNSTPRSKAHRQAKRAAGLVPLSTWVPASRKAEILAMIERALAEPPEEARLYIKGGSEVIIARFPAPPEEPKE